MATIRLEDAKDAAACDAIVATAFGPGRFAKTAYRLREGVARVAELSFVAEEGARIVGTVRYWPIVIGGDAALMLGPIAIVADRQGQGIALALQFDPGGILGAAGDIDPRAALAAQFNRLAEHHGGGARIAAGVLGFPRQFGIGDQSGLFALTLGDANFPLGRGQIRVAGKGCLQGLIQGQGRCPRKACTDQQQNAAGCFFQA
jgi:hypothetical protein